MDNPSQSSSQCQSIVILMAEDDPDDQKITRKAFERAKLRNRLIFVNDGQELLDYLHRRGEFADAEAHPFPDLILLDLNMPRKDGRAALSEIREDPELRHLPVVAMTTSKAEQDILQSYQLGVNSFITKPVTFNELVEVVQELNTYWVKIVKLPHA